MPKFVVMEQLSDEELMHIAEEFWIFYHREEMGADLQNDEDGGPSITGACFVTSLNGFVTLGPRGWRTSPVLKPGALK